jgi:hypothetical protein
MRFTAGNVDTLFCLFRIAQPFLCSVLQTFFCKEDHELFTLVFLLWYIGRWALAFYAVPLFSLFIFISAERKDIDFCFICGGLNEGNLEGRKDEVFFTLFYV